MLAYVCGQDLDDRGMVVTRFARQPLERVDTSQAHVEAFLIAELVDRARETLRDLALSIQRERARRIDRADNGNAASERRQQCSAHPPDLREAVCPAEPLRGGQPLRGPPDYYGDGQRDQG